MHKYIKKIAPPSFVDFFTPLAPPNRTNSFITEKEKNKFLIQFPNYFLPREWNSLSAPLKISTESHNKFKSSVTEFIMTSYPPIVFCKSKSCTDCFPTVIYLAW